MHFIRHIFLFLLVGGTALSLSAQRRYSPGIYIEAGAGTNLAFFDVGGGSPGLSVQGSVLYDLAPAWRLGANIGIHRARGSDEGTDQAERGYAFRSNLTEIAVKGVYVFRFKPRPIKKYKLKLEPRAFVNLGILQFHVRPNDLLAAQGNGETLPVAAFFSGGIGLAYRVSRELSVLFEAAGNISTSDYLDGYSDPENGPNPDVFCSMLIKFAYKVPTPWN